MASIFRRDAVVLHFGPRTPKDPRTSKLVRFKERRYVLWPALMYRVVAPEVRERRLNVLQKAVLGMCRAGITTAQRIGERLKIHQDLAALICLELQEQGALGSSGEVVQKGRELFEDETLESRRMVTGHVFQDPWSGDLWPRFLARLDYVELQTNPGGFPDLIFGTKGKPRRERAFMYLPGERAIPPAPQAAEILRATRRHRSALRSVGSFEAADQDDPRLQDGGVAVDRVSLVDEHPTAVFLATFIYLPEAGDLAGEWHACDPFGLGASPALRRALDREMQTSERLRDVVEGMIGRSLDAQIDQQRQWAADLRAQAIVNVERALSVSARELPQYTALIELEHAHVEVNLLGDACSEQKLRDVLGTARRVLEATFQAIAERHPLGEVWRRVYAQGRPSEDRAYVASVFEASAQVVGFRVPLPAALGGVKPSQIRATCHGDGWRLRGAIMAAILTARDDQEHPLRRAAAHDPGLLVDLDAIAKAAGEAVHAGDGALTPQSIGPIVTRVRRAVGLLTGLGTTEQFNSERT